MALYPQRFWTLRELVTSIDVTEVPRKQIPSKFDALRDAMKRCREFVAHDRGQIEACWDRAGYDHADPVPEWYNGVYRIALAKKNALAVRAGWCPPKQFGDANLQAIVDSVT